MLSRTAWDRACQVARTGGCLVATLPNLRAAYLIVHGRCQFPPDPFAE